MTAPRCPTCAQPLPSALSVGNMTNSALVDALLAERKRRDACLGAIMRIQVELIRRGKAVPKEPAL